MVNGPRTGGEWALLTNPPSLSLLLGAGISKILRSRRHSRPDQDSSHDVGRRWVQSRDGYPGSSSTSRRHLPWRQREEQDQEPTATVTVTAEATVSIDSGHFPGLLSFAGDRSRQQDLCVTFLKLDPPPIQCAARVNSLLTEQSSYNFNSVISFSTFTRRTAYSWQRVQFETTTLAHLLASCVRPETLEPGKASTVYIDCGCLLW